MDETSFATKKASTQKDVLSFYDQYAQTWDSRFGNKPSDTYFLNQRWQSFADMLDTDTRDVTAVELGVGTGVYIDRAARAFKKIIAVDGSPKMLEELEKKLEHFNISNVETQCADVTAISSLPDATADVVYFFGLVEHIIEIDAFFNEIRRILKPGGMVIGVMPNKKSPWYALRKMVRGTGAHCSSDRYYGLDNVRDWCRKYGFTCTAYKYWGCVPAGLSAGAFHILKGLEKPVIHSPFASFAGGITFKMQKTASNSAV